VDDNDLSVLDTHRHEQLVLQACHPRFFASQRYLVYARPVAIIRRS
jgi:sortase (surface protein transpeptidase)